jgi:hypothetical protein
MSKGKVEERVSPTTIVWKGWETSPILIETPMEK